MERRSGNTSSCYMHVAFCCVLSSLRSARPAPGLDTSQYPVHQAQHWPLENLLLSEEIYLFVQEDWPT